MDEVTKETYHELNYKFVDLNKAWPKHKTNNLIHIFDWNKVGFDIGGLQFDYSNFWLYGAYCLSYLLPYGFEHKKECLCYGQSIASYNIWRPKGVPTNSWIGKDIQNYVCPYEDLIYC